MSGSANLLVSFTSDPRGSLTPDQLAETGLASPRASLRNPQHTTITMAGATWSLRAVSGTALSNGQQIAIGGDSGNTAPSEQGGCSELS